MGYCSFTYVSNALMCGYVKWGSVNCATQLFDEMPQRDWASWNTMISCLVKDLQYERAFELFREWQKIDSFRADHFTISSLLTASKECFSFMKGREIHAHALKIGFESNVSVNNALIGFYTYCGSVKNVVALFERMCVKDVITWTGMVTGYMEFGLVESAMEVFNQMPMRNCISYNALLAGFCKNGEGLRALEVFRGMLENTLELSDFTLTSIINACAVVTEVKISKQIHGFVIKSGYGSNNAWIEGTLIDMCTKCGRMIDAQKLFSKWLYKQNESIVWTSMICGYARNGQHNEAMSLFCKMQADGDLLVDEVASTAALSVCGSLGFHEMGKQIHCYTLKSGFLSDLQVGNSIFSMYSKCGNMEDAVKFFDLMPKHDIVSWNGLITGHILHRNGDSALDVWLTMEKIGVKPDSITFMLILSAYKYTKSNSNSLDSCRGLFLSMKNLYGIEPTSEHYACMIGVLGYWGCFDEAEEMINKMNFESDALVWRALLDSCRLRSNTKLGRLAAKHLLAIEPKDPASYILVSNLYSASGRWHCSEKIREEMREKGLKKNPSQSWIIHENKIHSFFARDKSHSSTKDIYSGLDILILECIKAGYIPDTSFVLHEVEEHQKKDFLFYHSAKLAVTYGLLMTKLGRPIRVVKNIHLCGDCHTFFKYVSTVTRREIFFRDASVKGDNFLQLIATQEQQHNV
ncbi:Pentatricopeptide repeat [Macleaya cordata]|uniref:Pentatricopeptide repeat n=1 Tax=Macleaya cordata TaxID=56857 RepID=A0A200R598_MACCD|nr:Pentatricopeptide repeat [Macleaya cordata]